MTTSPPEQVREFVDRPNRTDPGAYVLASSWYYPGVIGGCGLVFAVLYACSGSVAGLMALSLGGALLGALLTLAATAWGVVIVFADDTRSGLWFTLFPPYMVVYAVRRWQWMAQPSVLFVCGVLLAGASLWAAQRQAESLSAEAPASATQPAPR
jgi:hypothetical protein